MIKLKKTKKNLALLTIIQIFLLINLPFSVSFLIKENSMVSADYPGDNIYCCGETREGEFCKDVSSSYSNCKIPLETGSCENLKCDYCCGETKDGEFCKDVNSLLVRQKMENFVRMLIHYIRIVKCP